MEIEDKIQMLDKMRATLEKLTKACNEGRQASVCPILEALDMNNERGEMTGLIDRIGETVKGNISKADLNPAEEATRKVILRHFASHGKAPSPAEIKVELGLPSVAAVKHAVEKLEKNDIVLRRNDKIVSSYPFSALETRHRVIFEDGREVYALCSTDALGIHFMLGEATTVLSRCPESEREIRIVLKNGRIESCEPQGAIEYISQGNGGCCTAETCCPNMNFFYSMGYLEKWKKKNPGQSNGETYTPAETLKHGKDIFGGFLENVRNKETKSRLKSEMGEVGACCQIKAKNLRRR
jgi:hypothetical protein